jgi:hypothetical protein
MKSDNFHFKLSLVKSFFCDKCKTLDRKLRPFDEYHISRHLFDMYSIYHIVCGIILGLIFKNVYYVVIIAILFEFWENSYFGSKLWKDIVLSLNKHELLYDDVINIIGDILCAVIGYYISRLGLKKSIISIVLFLLTLVLYIKMNPTTPTAVDHIRTIKRLLN